LCEAVGRRKGREFIRRTNGKQTVMQVNYSDDLREEPTAMSTGWPVGTVRLRSKGSKLGGMTGFGPL